MLYVTTRNSREPVTVHQVLTRDRGEDGGLFLPMHFPALSPAELDGLSGKSFNTRIAQLLNLFFSTKITSWDVDFAAGRYPVRLETFPHRIFPAELWHNPDWRFDRLEKVLMQLTGIETAAPESWGRIAVRMAILGALLCEREDLGSSCVDIAAVSSDLSMAVSALYLRKMGFPVGSIVICCNENNQLWELLCHGQMRTDAALIPTFIPEADVVLPANLERLISCCGGREETLRYLACADAGAAYSVSEAMLAQLREGLYISVVSSDRVETAIPNVYNSYRYLMTPAAALAYSGLMDYRSKSGITRSAVMLSENSPVCETEAIAKAMNLTTGELKKIMQ